MRGVQGAWALLTTRFKFVPAGTCGRGPGAAALEALARRGGARPVRDLREEAGEADLCLEEDLCFFVRVRGGASPCAGDLERVRGPSIAASACPVAVQ